MTRAFIVTLTLDDGTDLATVADEISDDLSDFDVVSVHPWGDVPPATLLTSNNMSTEKP